MRRLALSAAIALLALSAGAQRMYSPDFALGIRGGATLSNMAWQPSVRQSMTPGVTFGITARYTEEKYFGLVADLNITQRGWAEKYPDNPEFSYRRQFTYIQLPVMTHIYFGSAKFRGFVNIGPSIGYMLQDKITANFDYQNVASVQGYPSGRRTEQLTEPVYRKLDYGITGGIGMEFRAKRKHSFMLEGRYYFGIGNVFSSNRGDTFGASRPNSIEITAAYMFRLK
ncbi:MAG: PorT family protein [Bacteroides sp.]|nr:PorT family protein [Bacteroides sp.]MCM1380182.1 PorT family protein [Bacteroides sp.]MCM1446503.1 PorT family protein [Prevotella sp.]